MDKVNTRLNRFEIIFLIVSAVAIMTVVTTSSPIYPFNVWDDTNVYFTLGRGILKGFVPYRDLYEQKGPVFLFLYALAALISRTDFTGVWVLECAAASLFSLFSWKTVKLFFDKVPPVTIGFVPVLLSAVYNVGMFNFGGSSEEFCFPLLSVVFYIVLKMIRNGKVCLPGRKDALVCGVITGILLWTKYTFLGFMVTVVLYIIFRAVRIREFKKLLEDILFFLIGFFAVAVPIFVYYGVNGALSCMFESYFYNNIFNYYSEAEYSGVFANPVIRAIVIPFFAIWFTCRDYLDYTVVLLLSLLGLFAVDKKYRPEVISFSLLSFVVFLFFLFTRPTFIYYYGYILMFYSSFMTVFLVKLTVLFKQKYKRNNGIEKIVVIIIAVFVTFDILIKCKNLYLLKIDKDEMAQFKFARIINEDEDPKIFTYDIIDGGFYLASGVDPSNRYFTTMNFIENNREAVEEQERLIEEGYFDYIITIGDDYGWDNYELVTESVDPCIDYTEEVIFYRYNLYQRTDANA